MKAVSPSSSMTSFWSGVAVRSSFGHLRSALRSA